MKKNKFIILEGRAHGSYSYPDLLVSMGKYLFNKNSYEQYEALHKKNSFMLHPRMFVDFLSLISSGKSYNGNGKKVSSEKLNFVLGEIINARDPWRTENLDAYFEVKNRAMNIMYYKLNADGKFEKVIDSLKRDLNSEIPTKDRLIKEAFYNMLKIYNSLDKTVSREETSKKLS